MVSPSDWLVSSVLFFCLSTAAAWSAPPPVRCGSLSLHAILCSGGQLCSPQLSCFGGGFSLCLFTGISVLGAYFFAPPPLSQSGSVFHQTSLLSVYYAGLLSVFQFCGAVWLWVLLLAQKMIFVIHYLSCFREWLITYSLSAFLPFQHLFTDSSAEISSCLSPFLQCTFSDPAPSAVC
jgi:hypothetical protein